MDERDRTYLRSALESAYLVQTYVDIEGPEWHENGMVLDAICKRIEEVGHNLGRVSDELQAEHPEVPWRKAIGMRHVIAHEYVEIDVGIVIRVVNEHMPALIAQIEAMLEA